MDYTPISVESLQNFNKELIHYFVDGDIERPNSCFAPFKWIDLFILQSDRERILTKNLEMIDKAKICIYKCFIWSSDIVILYESFGDRIKTLKVYKLTFSKNDNEEISNEAVETINQINPFTLSLNKFDWSYDTLKMLSNFNPANIGAKFKNNRWILAELMFTNVTIIMFDSKQNQRMKLICRSAKIEIDHQEFKNICLLKTDKSKYSNSDYLFIPFTSVLRLKILDKRIDNSLAEHEKQLTLINKDIGISEGLIMPVNQISLAIFYLYYTLTNSLKENLIVTNEILRMAKQVDWRVKYFDELIEIKNMSPDHFYRIKFSFFNFNAKALMINPEIKLSNQTLTDVTFSTFRSCNVIFEDELNLVWDLLNSQRTRFNLLCVELELNLLSDCLTVLSLCEKCPELNSVSLKFTKWDEDDKKEAIDSAIKKFRRNFGFIQLIEIKQS